MKDKLTIQGLGGEKTLQGTIKINGAKNAALKAMAASILFDGPVILNNVPDTNDTTTLINILKKLGAKVSDLKNGRLEIDSTNINSTEINHDLGRSMRTSVVLTGPILSRYGQVSLPAPGGCVIGARPIDLFISGYQRLGAVTKESENFYEISARKKLVGSDITFSKISVGATETLMMAAVLAEGKTILNNCALEPEIVNVAEWLNECGANIRGMGTPTIEIEGTNGKLLIGKKEYIAISDRIETGSYLILGGLCARELTIENCRPDHIEALITLLKESGLNIVTTATSVILKNNTQPNLSFKSLNVKTHEYPGLATDLQAPLSTYLTQVSGDSTLLETIFEGRFKYTEDLTKMGASITVMNPHEIIIKGPTPLTALSDGEELQAHDIRAGFAIVLAALVGKGKSVVNNVHLIDRGYEKLEEKLKGLGAEIERISKI